MTTQAVSSGTPPPSSFTFTPAGVELRAAEAHTAPQNSIALKATVTAILTAHRAELEAPVIEALDRVVAAKGTVDPKDSPTLYDAALALHKAGTLSAPETASLIAAVRGMSIGLSAANVFSC